MQLRRHSVENEEDVGEQLSVFSSWLTPRLKKGWWRKVLKFMVPSMQIRQIIRNKVQRANLKELQKEKLSDKLKTDLYNEYFKEDIIKFEKLTNKKLSW